ncbi:G-type lectin S-receptor-like serine/threonine-protein kinase At2g19130 [Tripterygium wilfordii]|uniref:G-type lectin S-receptor-like serine/threonine-protein kinase At2g19130 n=1 Tax=Tripterygium wilfordii TaxID=458696 RepID=UPI0018F853E2|nr:G-type lectin S-receptor-like serine/threonine-protein kinase At2g19130 [Tripterygium wilfordii]
MDAKNNPWFLVFVIFIYFSHNSHHSLAADTISGNQSISGDQTLVSPGGDFILGFFKPGNSSNNYIGMWYGKVSTQTIVWVANRDNPISDIHSSELRISDGNLVLFDESKSPIWSTSVNSTSSSPVEAALRDDGNLVLRDGSNSTDLLWQSLDHPTNTWLPGGRLGLNKRTGETQLLLSWKNEQDPAPGLFNLELDPNGTSQYYILWNRSQTYWTSGTWNGKIFSDVPEMTANYIYDFSYVTNDNENYFTYSLKDKTIISRFVMDVSGRIQQLSWLENSKQWNLFWSQPRTQCEVYSFCGAFGSCNDNSQVPCTCLTGFEPKSQADWDLLDYSGGCKRKTSLQCGNTSLPNGQSDKFAVTPNVNLNQDSQKKDVGSSEECKSTCLSDCSCTAYAYDSNGCSIWIGDLSVTQLAGTSSNGMTVNIRLAASEFNSSSNNRGMMIGVIVGSVTAVVFLVILALIYTRHRMRRTIKAKAVDGSLLAFGYRDLQNATKNFSEKLGGGGFGSVFKGVLPDSSVIAVKKLEGISQGEKQFRTEVSTIGTIQHVNLVRLRGFCSEGSRRLLVYDYMPNVSLDSHLFHEKNLKVLDWKTRYQIALGTARGLTYLHEKCRECIIHCDIKPENILLDAQFCPKVADFGLAKLVGREFSRVLTTMRGTRGYLAPEWISGVAITPKADVYSYGMMVFELVSGKRNAAESEDGKVKFFPSWAASQIIQGGDVLSLLDPRLEENADVAELTKVCKVACWCIQDDETFRPSMGQVVQILEGVVDVSMPPLPRSLQMFVDNQEHIIFFTESSSSGKSSLTQSSTSTASSQPKSTISSTSSTTQLGQ